MPDFWRYTAFCLLLSWRALTPEKAEIGEFLEYIAKARYVQELEKNIIARAISEVFGGE